MGEDLKTVLTSVFEVFGLVAVAYVYARRVHFPIEGATRIGMDLLVPSLAFTAIVESRIHLGELPVLTLDRKSVV